MKELLQIRNGSIGEYLKNYCLTLYYGDIMYIQGKSGRSLHALESLLAGEKTLESGYMYLYEKKMENWTADAAIHAGVYIEALGRELVPNLSVADNLMGHAAAYHVYNRKKVQARVSTHLKEEEIEIDPTLPAWILTEEEQKKLGLIKARIVGARIVIVDMIRNEAEGKLAEELCTMMLKMKQEGISFIVLASRYTTIANIANRIQILGDGRDQMEWNTSSSEDVLSKLRMETLQETHTAGEKNEGQSMGNQQLIGLYDSFWSGQGQEDRMLAFLKKMRVEAPDIWEMYIDTELPSASEKFEKGTVLLSTDAMQSMIPGLSISENLTIMAGKRIASSRYGKVNRRLEKALSNRYLQLAGIYEKAIFGESVMELSLLEQKKLAVCRWALLRPKVMFLEKPWNGLNSTEVWQFTDFLKQIASDGCRLFCCSASTEELKQFCGKVLCFDKGKNRI